MPPSRFPLAALLLASLLAGCATAPKPVTNDDAPMQWQAPTPHQGSNAALSAWWRGHGDLLLAELIDAAQAAGPTLSAARSKIAEAHAVRVGAGAALLPTMDSVLQVSRNSAQPPLPMATTLQGALQASWEIDLYGGMRANRDSAEARLEAAQAGWHDARVTLAAEVAGQYYRLRSCEKLLEVTAADAASRSETARLTGLAANAGFQAPATAAEGNSRAIQQRAICDIDIKALVALSAMAEPDLRRRLQQQPGVLPQDATLQIPAMPVALLAQRPDLARVARDLAAAAADIGVAEAQRYPRLALAGSIGAARFRSAELSGALETWSVGPVQVTLPLFDGGRRAVNVEVARERYENAAIQYRAAVRGAVREVEQALVTLDATARRSGDARIAVEGYTASFVGIQARYRSGLASLLELEEARRVRLAAETALLLLQNDRTAAWIPSTALLAEAGTAF